MEFTEKSNESNERLIAYSLGNFVSNQRTRKRDGGAIFQLIIEKKDNEVKITNCGYYLTWVYKPLIDNKRKFEILPCSIMESELNTELDFISKEKMELFLLDSRTLLKKENKNVNEIKIIKTNANNVQKQ
jgi:poly-gamma-glutamate synthesis protein (capsule biosynthesis protein)